MKQYAVFLPMLDVEKSIQYRPQHLKYLEDLRQEGKILCNGRFSDGAGGLVIYHAHSLLEATAIAESDPYVENGARDYIIHEWELVINKDLMKKIFI